MMIKEKYAKAAYLYKSVNKLKVAVFKLQIA